MHTAPTQLHHQRLTRLTGGRRPRAEAVAMVIALVVALAALVPTTPAGADVGLSGGSTLVWVHDGELIAQEGDGSNRRSLTGDLVDPVTQEHRPQFSPDGRSVLVASEENLGDDATKNLVVVGLDGAITVIPDTEGAAFGPLSGFSPDGMTILYEDALDVFTVPAHGSASPTMVPDEGLRIRDAAWSPDGTRIAVGQPCCNSIDPNDAQVYVLDPAGVEDPLLISDADDFQARSVAWYPDGDILYDGNLDGDPALIRASGDGTDDHVDITGDVVTPRQLNYRIAPTGDQVLFRTIGFEGNEVHLVPGDGSAAPTALVPGDEGSFPAQPWDQAGEQVAFSEFLGGGLTELWVEDVTDADPPVLVHLPGTDHQFGDVSFSPDGTHLAVVVTTYDGGTWRRVCITDLVNSPGNWSCPDQSDSRWVVWSPERPPQDLFDDLPAHHQFHEPIEWMVANEIAQGYEDGTFRPADPVSRQAVAAFLYRYLGGRFTPPATATFPDVPTTSPFFDAVEWMAAEGITRGYADGTFRPGDPVSRQAVAAFLHRAADSPAFSPTGQTFPDVPTTSPFHLAIEWLADAEITNGYADGTFRPGDPVSRQAVAAFLYRFDQLPDEEE